VSRKSVRQLLGDGAGALAKPPRFRLTCTARWRPARPPRVAQKRRSSAIRTASTTGGDFRGEPRSGPGVPDRWCRSAPSPRHADGGRARAGLRSE
jgi:hypothetical protein